jgi:cellobiose-specific phosphotransferase system component IIC
MATAKNELLLLRTFRLALPAALFVTLLWTLEFNDALKQSIYNGLGANANNIVFILGILLVLGLYWFMGVYERKILYENRHTRPAF